MHQTFYYFLSQHELRLDSQFGFRSSRSCELAIANLSDYILTNMDNKLLLLVDWMKAFDLVDHNTCKNFNGLFSFCYSKARFYSLKKGSNSCEILKKDSVRVQLL